MGGEGEMKCKIGECLEGDWGSRCGRGAREGKSWTDRWNERTLVNKLILGTYACHWPPQRSSIKDAFFFFSFWRGRYSHIQSYTCVTHYLSYRLHSFKVGFGVSVNGLETHEYGSGTNPSRSNEIPHFHPIDRPPTSPTQYKIVSRRV